MIDSISSLCDDVQNLSNTLSGITADVTKLGCKSNPIIDVVREEPNLLLPQYATIGSSGMDLRAYIPKPVEIKPSERVVIPTGLRISIPAGYEGQVRSRSGLALKEGVIVLNAPGTIDSDYTGPLNVILINLSKTKYTVNNGDRIAQLIIAPYTSVYFSVVEELKSSDRGVAGFGSTGIK